MIKQINSEMTAEMIDKVIRITLVHVDYRQMDRQIDKQTDRQIDV